MKTMKHARQSAVTTLLAMCLTGAPLWAQQQKPGNPQLPDPSTETQSQPPVSTESGAHSSSTPQSAPEAGIKPAENKNDGKETKEAVSASSQQSFTGKIVKSKGDYLLRDDNSKVTYKLDRQDLARDYEGKNVKVTGSLESGDNTIHVTTIAPAS